MTAKQFMFRLLPMAASLIIVLLLAFSCSAFTGNDVLPAVSDANKDYVTAGDISVSNEEVYNALIDSYGSREVSKIITKDLLTNGAVDYVALAKADTEFDVVTKTEETIYGVTLAEAYNYYTQAQIDEMDQTFNDNLVYNGYTNIDAYYEDIYLEHARDLYTKDQLRDNGTLTYQDLKDYYETSYYDSVCAVVVRFNTLEEAYATLSDEGLSVTSAGLFEENPTNEQVLEAYVNIYNKVNGTLAPISYEGGFVPECTTDALTYDAKTAAEDNSQLADFLFTRLSTVEAVDPYTGTELLPYATPTAITTGSSSAYYIAYKVIGDNVNQFVSFYDALDETAYSELLASSIVASDLTGELALAYEELLTEQSLISTNITTEFTTLFSNAEVTIYDPFLRSQFEMTYGETPQNNGDQDIVVSYLDASGNMQTITADELFSSLSRKAPTVVINLMNTKLAVADEDAKALAFTDTAKTEAEAQLQEYKTTFLGGGYVDYGYSPDAMTWTEFMYGAFGYRDEVELYNGILSGKAVEAYQANIYVSEENQEIYYDLMVNYYEEAFSIDLMHILVYLDQNNDGTPDINTDTWYSAEQTLLAQKLTDTLRTEFTKLVASEEVTIDVLQSLVDLYNAASYETDETSENYSMWAEFKVAGFRLKAEDLSTVTPGMMVTNFEAEAKAMYDEMVQDSLFTLISDNNVSTEFGYHLVYASGYTEKRDAYPEDDDLVFPSRNEITTFNDQDFASLSSDIILFIGEYYTPAQDAYLTTHQITIFDEARAAYGTPTFNTHNIGDAYNALVSLNKVIAERN